MGWAWVGLGVGGVLGAWLRFMITNLINRYWRYSFPIATFSINMIGSFALSSLYLFNFGVHQKFILYTFGSGLLGAFTTFSTFSYETALLLDRRAILASLSYFVLSVMLGIFCAWLATVLV